MHIFVAIYNDKLFKLNGLIKNTDLFLETNETGCRFEFHSVRNSKIKPFYVLRPDFNNTSGGNKEIFNTDVIRKLHSYLKQKFPEQSKFVIAIHWGANDTSEGSQQLCRCRLDELKEETPDIVEGSEIILTHYSGLDSFIKGVNETKDISSVIKKINERIEWQEETDDIDELYKIKENLLRTLFPLNFWKSLPEHEQKQIFQAVQEKISLERASLILQETILKTGDDKISIDLKPGEPNIPSSEDYNEKLKDLRKYLNGLIDQQLSKAGRESIYGDR